MQFVPHSFFCCCMRSDQVSHALEKTRLKSARVILARDSIFGMGRRYIRHSLMVSPRTVLKEAFGPPSLGWAQMDV